jgi:hypothetical protein
MAYAALRGFLGVACFAAWASCSSSSPFRTAATSVSMTAGIFVERRDRNGGLILGELQRLEARSNEEGVCSIWN